MKKNIWLVKCLGYTLSFSILVCIIELLMFHYTISDQRATVMLFVLCVIAAPLYPAVKGDDSPPLLYNAVAMLTHIIFDVAAYFALYCNYPKAEWRFMAFTFLERRILLFFVITVLVDTVVCVIRKNTARKRSVQHHMESK